VEDETHGPPAVPAGSAGPDGTGPVDTAALSQGGRGRLRRAGPVRVGLATAAAAGGGSGLRPEPGLPAGPAVGELLTGPVGPVARGRHLTRAPTRIRRLVGLPYGLVLPSVLALLGLLGYPLVTLVLTSFKRLDLRQLIRRETVWVGTGNYSRILADHTFWTVTLRTLAFAAVCVALTLVGGTLVGLLLRRLAAPMRLLVSVSMLLAWATPTVSAATVFKWLFDEDYGVVNWLVSTLTPVDWSRHSWFDSVWPAFFVLTLCVVWQAIPFVALTIYAGLTSIPEDIYEAARIDGAGAWRQFWSVTGPMLKPIFLILTSLSVIWDLKTFAQNYVITRGGPAGGTLLLNLYTYQQGFGVSRFGTAAAAAVVMVAITLVATGWYVRSMLRVGEAEL
jgi:N,N'-diacetylchitobiose transport system permease protein